MTYESIIKRLFRRDGKINTAAIRQDRLDKETYKYIMSQYPEYTTLRDKLLSIKHGKVCQCFTCGSIMPWPNHLTERHYCSRECGNNSPHKIQVTKTASQTDEVKRRRKQTCIERYGERTHSSLKPFKIKQKKQFDIVMEQAIFHQTRKSKTKREKHFSRNMELIILANCRSKGKGCRDNVGEIWGELCV